MRIQVFYKEYEKYFCIMSLQKSEKILLLWYQIKSI